MFDVRSVIRDIFDKFTGIDTRLNKLETYESGFTQASGNISMDDNAVVQVVSTIPAKMLNFQQNNTSLNCTPDYVNNQIGVLYPGEYLTIFTVSFSGDPNITFEMYLRVNGVEQPFGIHRKLGAGGDVGAAAGHGFLVLAAGDLVSVYVQSDSGAGANFTASDASLSIHRVF